MSELVKVRFFIGKEWVRDGCLPAVPQICDAVVLDDCGRMEVADMADEVSGRVEL